MRSCCSGSTPSRSCRDDRAGSGGWRGGLRRRSRSTGTSHGTGQAQDASANSGGDEPDWITYYGPAHLDRDLGRALLHLAINGGDHTAAQAHLVTAIDRFPQRHSRGKTLAIANLAHLTMARDDPHHGATLGHSALDGLGPIRSDRVFEALRQLRIAGRRHRTIAAVRELNARIDRALKPA